MQYSISDGHLEVKDELQGGRVKWRGSFGGTVYRAIPLPSTNDCIIIVEYPNDTVDNNVMRVAPDGSVVWRADPAPEWGCYSDVTVVGTEIFAQSWSSYIVRLDLEQGLSLEKNFNK
jgi:hypothetical protein